MILRQLIEGKQKPIYFREVRPHLMAESLTFEADTAMVSELLLVIQELICTPKLVVNFLKKQFYLFITIFLCYLKQSP